MSDEFVENRCDVEAGVIEDNLFNYLRQLDERVWRRLFLGRASLRAIFRSLDELEQLIVYRLLYIQQAVSERALRLWMSSDSVGDLRRALSVLQSYNIIQVVDIPSKDGKQQYKIHNDFKNGFIELLSEGSVSFENDLTLASRSLIPSEASNEEKKDIPTLDDLILHARHKLDFLLLFLVSPSARKSTLRANKLSRKIKRLKKNNDGSSAHLKKIKTLEDKFNKLSKNSGTISQDLLQVFRRFGMMEGVNGVAVGDGMSMSRQTLSWLLKDVTNQLVSLLVGYLRNLEGGYLTGGVEKGQCEDELNQRSSMECIDTALESVSESLDLLLSLSQAHSGDSFHVNALTKCQLRLLRLLYELGIVYYKTIKGPFYVYDLSYIIGGRNLMNELYLFNNNSSRIIVQSNFKVYVYTASPLQISVLSHLCELQARTPNLVVGVLTRESVQSAFKSGITSHEIIRFLTCKNSHTNDYNVPENVTKQLFMWESERNRIELTHAILLKHWDIEYLPELFQRTVRWAQNKRYELFHTKWPTDPHSQEFALWMKNEKYLACVHYARDEIINKIKLIRNDINNKQSQKSE